MSPPARSASRQFLIIESAELTAQAPLFLKRKRSDATSATADSNDIDGEVGPARHREYFSDTPKAPTGASPMFAIMSPDDSLTQPLPSPPPPPEAARGTISPSSTAPASPHLGAAPGVPAFLDTQADQELFLRGVMTGSALATSRLYRAKVATDMCRLWVNHATNNGEHIFDKAKLEQYLAFVNSCVFSDHQPMFGASDGISAPASVGTPAGVLSDEADNDEEENNSDEENDNDEENDSDEADNSDEADDGDEAEGSDVL